MNAWLTVSRGSSPSVPSRGTALIRRKCACGGKAGPSGECAECRRKRLGRQAGLLVGPANDAAEREANRVGDWMSGGRGPGGVGVAPPRVQRASAPAGQHPGPLAPASVEAALAGPGQPLEPALERHMGAEFRHDFSRVRVHCDAAATRSAEDVGAEAYTLGNDIVFGPGRYAPATRDGRRLIAHELTHVAQQAGPAGARSLRRKVAVDKPKDPIDNPTGKGLVQTNAATVENYLRTLCSEGGVTVDKGTGVVSLKASFCPTPMPPNVAGPPAPAPADTAKEATGCGCLCDLIGSANDFTILVDDKDWPHTSGRVVTTPSPNSPKLWGAATETGKTLTIDPWLVLGHELCGHAWLAEKGLPDDNATRGEGGHQETVARENKLRKEHGIEARGNFKAPFCGESFWQTKAGPGPIEWSTYMKKCQAWRVKTYGNKYKISDKIP